MTFSDYLEHYTHMPDLLIFGLTSLLVVGLVHGLIVLFCKPFRKDVIVNLEKYYELMISSTSMLLFIGLFFLIEYRYFSFDSHFYEIWNQYNDFLLLLALIIAVLLINVVDWLIVPLRRIGMDKKSTLRMMAMIFMLLIFAYIKVIYEDDNYDSIIIYFLIMVIGRFVYFDASFKEFLHHMKAIFMELPTLFLSLLTTGALAYFGFGSGYLLKKNGVVLSLWIAQIFVIAEICIINAVIKLTGLRCGRRH